jgi:hypothetical protein
VRSLLSPIGQAAHCRSLQGRQVASWLRTAAGLQHRPLNISARHSNRSGERREGTNDDALGTRSSQDRPILTVSRFSPPQMLAQSRFLISQSGRDRSRILAASSLSTGSIGGCNARLFRSRHQSNPTNMDCLAISKPNQRRVPDRSQDRAPSTNLRCQMERPTLSPACSQSGDHVGVIHICLGTHSRLSLPKPMS